MNDRAWPCAVCENWHAPGSCPEGVPAPSLDFCPRCREQRRGDGLLVPTYDARGKPKQACVMCGYGTVKAPKAPRRRKKARVRR